MSLYLSSIVASSLINASISDQSFLFSLSLVGFDLIVSSFSMMVARFVFERGMRLSITRVATVISSIAVESHTRIVSIREESSTLSLSFIPELWMSPSCISMSFFVLSIASSQFSIRVL